MPKVDLEIVEEVLSRNDLDQDTVKRILRQLTRAAERAAEEATAHREPPVKKQWIILISDPRGEVPDEDFVGWVLQIPEHDNPNTAPDRLIRAAHTFNTSPRGRKHPARSLAEACEVVSPKLLKEHSLAVKTKLPVTVLKTDNVLPPDAAAKISIDDLRRR